MKKIETLAAVAVMAACGAYAAVPELPVNGSEWKDTSGKRINAHGGGMLHHGGKWWWYGEDRGLDRTKGDGVHVYSSSDLKTWKDEGVAFKKHDNVGSMVGIGCVIERPKVVYCEKTGKFVMFFHLELADYSYTAAMVGILSSDRPQGPFAFHRAVRPNACQWPQDGVGAELTPDEIRKLMVGDPDDIPGGENDLVRNAPYPYVWHYASGQMCRDMTLYRDTDGKVYHIFASEHNSTLHIAELTDDCLGYTGRWWRMGVKDWTEAPAVFRHGGKYWLVGSGCTGWAANAARLYVADKITGPWTRLPNPCKGVSPATKLDGEKCTFGCQSTYAIQLSENDIIVMFDEWRREDLADSRYHWFKVSFDAKGTPEIRP